MPTPTPLPFEATRAEIARDFEPFIDSVFSGLESDFLSMPKGNGFVDYPLFEAGYEQLKQASQGFRMLSADRLLPTVTEKPISIVVLRAMLGFTPPEWAYVASTRSGISISQGWARTLDRNIRLAPLTPLKSSALTDERLRVLIEIACALLREGAEDSPSETLHRLDKADTKDGVHGIANLAKMGAPYAMLLYERFLGRPFASHRDSVSEIIGNRLESAIEETLDNSGVSFRKTRRAERVEGFDQTPDFIIPSEFNPQVVIEAKITEDDGTARDKVTRIQHLDELSRRHGQKTGTAGFEVVACIGGRGFGVRREDMKKILLATGGKVFTARTLEHLVSHTRIREFAQR